MRERKREVRLRVNAKVVYLLLRLLWWMEKGRVFYGTKRAFS